jgi:acetyltransferase-like isoleucine patch superfamily enzyme
MVPLAVKQLYLRLFRSPAGVTMSPGAQVIRPFRVTGGSYLSIGRDSFIGHESYIAAYDEYKGQRFQPRIRIGKGVYIGPHVYLTAVKEIFIEDGCVLSEYVYITDEFHGMSPESGPIMDQPLETKGPVRIGPNCFLGFRCCVMPGVRLGPHCIVGANSVVTKSFPGYVMLGGVPAKVIKVFWPEKKAWVRPAEAVGLPNIEGRDA